MAVRSVRRRASGRRCPARCSASPTRSSWAGSATRRGPRISARAARVLRAVHQHRAEVRRLPHPCGQPRLAELNADPGRRRPFVRDLKGKNGGEIAVMGGIAIVRHLFLAGLIDELSLITHPVIAGQGRRHLFQPGDPVTRLVLRASCGPARATSSRRMALSRVSRRHSAILPRANGGGGPREAWWRGRPRAPAQAAPPHPSSARFAFGASHQAPLPSPSRGRDNDRQRGTCPKSGGVQSARILRQFRVQSGQRLLPSVGEGARRADEGGYRRGWNSRTTDSTRACRPPPSSGFADLLPRRGEGQGTGKPRVASRTPLSAPSPSPLRGGRWPKAG